VNFEKQNFSKTQKILFELKKQNIKNNLIFILTDDIDFSDEKILRLL
jgi:hypothetical protein